MSNLVCTLNMIYKHIWLIMYLNDTELIFIRTLKWFQVLLYNTQNLILVICVRALFREIEKRQTEIERNGLNKVDKYFPAIKSIHLKSIGFCVQVLQMRRNPIKCFVSSEKYFSMSI